MDEIHAYDCREAFRRIHDYVDRELSAAEMALVREHLEVCAVCAREFRFEVQLLDDLRVKLRRLAAPAGLKARVLAALPPAPPPRDA